MAIGAGGSLIGQVASGQPINWKDIALSGAIGGTTALIGGGIATGLSRTSMGLVGRNIVQNTTEGLVDGIAEFAQSPGPHTTTNLIETVTRNVATDNLTGGIDLLKKGVDSHSIAELGDQLPHHNGGRAPVLSGQEGVAWAEEELSKAGHTIRGKEVSIKYNAPDGGSKRVRLDLFTEDSNGKLIGIEVKNGPHASFTPNQKEGFPILRESGGIPVGKRASEAGFIVGERVESFNIEVIGYGNGLGTYVP